jgi:hypothetical protein
VVAAHSSPDSSKRSFTGDSTHRQRGLAGWRRGSDDLATSSYELDDDDLRGTERVRVAVTALEKNAAWRRLLEGRWQKMVRSATTQAGGGAVAVGEGDSDGSTTDGLRGRSEGVRRSGRRTKQRWRRLTVDEVDGGFATLL